MTTPKAPHQDTAVLNALVKNTEALTNLNGVLMAIQTEFVDGKRQAREGHLALSAKLDNFDRSVAEMKLASEHSEIARQAELQRIYTLLGEERRDRKEITASAGKDERELLREMIREEIGERRKKGSLFVSAAQATWAAGGKYIVLAVALLIVASVMKMTGLTLADILGLAGK